MMRTRPPSACTHNMSASPGPSPEFARELHQVIAILVRRVLDDAPPARLYETAEFLMPDLLRAMSHQPASTVEVRLMARALTRSVADHTPLPGHRFATRPLPRPGRNDPCDCGSLRKYKQCCMLLEQGAPPPPTEGINMLPYVLDCLPMKRWGELVGSAVDPLALDHAARGMIEVGDADRVVRLLEPFFKDQPSIPARHEPLLDTLLDAFTDLDRPRKKQRLIDWALAHGDHVIRSSMHQRLASMAADRGDFDTAWQHFQRAQREHADAGSLSHLEVILLLNQGETARASERARFWIGRLQRIDAAGYAGLIGFLRRVAEDGHMALLDVQSRQQPELALLYRLIQAAPEPAVHHEFIGDGPDHLGSLRPDRALAGALAHWERAFPRAEPMLTSLVVEDHPAWNDPRPWLECLHQQPLLWHSFQVVDDLILALASDWSPALKPLCDGLLARGEALLRRALDAHPGKTLEWGFHANRPALRLLAQAIALGGEPTADVTLERMEWMLSLNPDDNHGYREPVCALRLRRGEAVRALAITERFPDDSSLAFARVLALYALDRRGEALEVLRDAHAGLPLVAPMLVVESARKPKLRQGWITYGGPDQAWFHRELFRPAWERCEGALDWLGRALGALKPGRR